MFDCRKNEQKECQILQSRLLLLSICDIIVSQNCTIENESSIFLEGATNFTLSLLSLRKITSLFAQNKILGANASLSAVLQEKTRQVYNLFQRPVERILGFYPKGLSAKKVFKKCLKSYQNLSFL